MDKIKQFEIVVGLGLAGSSVAQVARELGCSHTLVSNVIRGKETSKKSIRLSSSKSKAD
jgi:hypothetical protein